MTPPMLLVMYALAAEPATPLLVEAKDVLDGTLPKSAKIIDVRSPAKYELGHLPGARQLSFAAWSKAVTDDKADGTFWSKAFAEARLDPSTMTPLVMVGDDMREVCRGWWLLRHAGVKDVRVFNGTTKTFTDAGGKLSTESVKEPDVKIQEWKPQASVHARKEDVLKHLDAKGTVIDGRSPGEYADGHVPKAKHLEWSELIEDKTGRFKTVDAMKKLFAERGIDPSESPTCYCASGGRASVVAFCVELVSGKPTRNYYRSWTEWGSDPNTPKEK